MTKLFKREVHAENEIIEAIEIVYKKASLDVKNRIHTVFFKITPSRKSFKRKEVHGLIHSLQYERSQHFQKLAHFYIDTL